ncbi:glycosyltransferase family 4 protein [Palaeococcus ferrophilus]|uniref:glycosyltransferase family 4 protein n=1 Tax=Palaeococcus ferrophilus TaxID=83868 RepID=UPI00064F79CF|nr:glycosyltransferase family 4 protein [Palaeococcus ferrophilus]
MRINYTMFGIGPTGGNRVLVEIANRLAERGHEISITTLGDEPQVKKIPFSISAKVNLIYTGPNKVWKLFLLGLRRISNLHMPQYDGIERLSARMPDCDINVATYCLTAYPVFISGKGIPFYHMQHYETLFFDDHYLKKLAEITYYLPLNKISNSIWLHNIIRERYGVETPILNPAIDHNIFYPREVNGEKKKLRVVAYGSNRRWKGFPELLEAMAIVFKHRKDIEFIVYGPARPKYSHPTVNYTFVQSPSDEELAVLYSSADVVVTPSWYESFPLPPLEAMACGAPVVTTRYGTEDYAFHEKNALVVPPKDPKALADAILRLLEDEDLREQFRKEGPKTARQFTWDKTVDNVERLFKKALKGDGIV